MQVLISSGSDFIKKAVDYSDWFSRPASSVQVFIDRVDPYAPGGGVRREV